MTLTKTKENETKLEESILIDAANAINVKIDIIVKTVCAFISFTSHLIKLQLNFFEYGLL